MNDTSFFFLHQGLLPPHLLAARLHVCAPETAFRLYPTVEMRHWCQQQPGILFPFGWLRFPGHLPARYAGGLVNDAALFLFVPSRLYERHWRLLTKRCTTACPVGRRTGTQAEQAWSISDGAVCQEKACTQQVQYWMQFLAARQERPTAGWHW